MLPRAFQSLTQVNHAFFVPFGFYHHIIDVDLNNPADQLMDDAEEKDNSFLTPNDCLMIFRGSAAYDSKRRQKVARHEVYTTKPATPPFLRWSESAITFDRTDHPDSVLHLGRYPLVVDLIVGPKRLTKVLMDGGSGLNIMYAKTLDEMGIDRTHLRPTPAPFHGIVPGK